MSIDYSGLLASTAGLAVVVKLRVKCTHEERMLKPQQLWSGNSFVTKPFNPHSKPLQRLYLDPGLYLSHL